MIRIKKTTQQSYLYDTKEEKQNCIVQNKKGQNLGQTNVSKANGKENRWSK
jgi:hypothetical protein